MGVQKCIDFRVDYGIVKFTNNHEEWHDEIWLDDCPATFLPKGANARIHEVKDGKRNHQTSPLCEVFWFLGRGEITMQDSIIHEMEYYPVSTFVNSVKNNDPNCIKPIDENL